jgi:hypothetical protein
MNLLNAICDESAGSPAAQPSSGRRAPLFFHFDERFFGQNGRMSLESIILSSMSLLFVRRAAICFCLGIFLLVSTAAFGQTNYYSTNGTEYAIIGQLPGDQVWPSIAVSTNGGFLVWEDNATDGSGWGVSARRLDGTLSGTLGTFRVNVQGTNDQENPRVALLKNGGAVFVWQGGVEGLNQHIYARFVNSGNIFLTSTDVVVSTFPSNFQVNPDVTVLNNGNVVVVWSSFDQVGPNSLQDVYAQIFTQTGQSVGTNFLVNQFTPYNQRVPAVAALANGGFVAVWVSEQQRAVAPNLGTGSTNTSGLPTYQSPSGIATPSVDIFARTFTSGGLAAGNEFLVNSNLFPCANPDVAAGSDGSFMVVWGGHDITNYNTSWDIFGRGYSSTLVGGPIVRVNSTVIGDQYGPHISGNGTNYMVVWTSLGQDGSREGVYGQFVRGNGSFLGTERLVNTTTVGQQLQPAVASDGVSQFVVVWSSYTGSPYNFDLFGQRYLNTSGSLLPMPAPFVWAPFALSNGLYQPQLAVSWSPLLGISVANYEVYADSTNAAMGVTASNVWTMTAANGLKTNSVHTFWVDYVLSDGRKSPLSPSTMGQTWIGRSWGGIPYEWMTNYFGANTNLWPASGKALAPGVTVQQVFLSGGDPNDSGTWLRTQVGQTPQGMFLSWNTQPGLMYQVQVTADLISWVNLGAPRFAAGTSDSIYIGGGPVGYYRILLQR